MIKTIDVNFAPNKVKQNCSQVMFCFQVDTWLLDNAIPEKVYTGGFEQTGANVISKSWV